MAIGNLRKAKDLKVLRNRNVTKYKELGINIKDPELLLENASMIFERFARVENLRIDANVAIYSKLTPALPFVDKLVLLVLDVRDDLTKAVEAPLVRLGTTLRSLKHLCIWCYDLVTFENLDWDKFLTGVRTVYLHATKLQLCSSYTRSLWYWQLEPFSKLQSLINLKKSFSSTWHIKSDLNWKE